MPANRIAFASLVIAAALVLLVASRERVERARTIDGGSTATSAASFVEVSGTLFVAGGEEFRFVGANVATVYGEEERRRMPETLAGVGRAGVRVVRVWAHGEWDAGSPARAPNEWLGAGAGAFRTGRDEWNEAAFVHLDRTLAEAARQGLRVQICLSNWWRDTGGVVQYLAWANVANAADDRQPFGIDRGAATEFYTNEEARRLYREHVRRIVARRNTVTGELYTNDPTIFAYELMNEAQAPAGREGERRAWIDEMSRFVKSLDANHLVTPGTWGYRTAGERREWLADHRLPAVDFCDVHVYPRDDTDSFITTPTELRGFVENRQAAALSIRKPLVFGEFGMTPEGFAGRSQAEWFRAYFTSAAEAGNGGAFFWIVTPDARREYGVSLSSIADAGARDEAVWNEIMRGAELFRTPSRPPRRLYDAAAFRVPHVESYTRDRNDDPRSDIEIIRGANDSIIYRFAPEAFTRAEFERLGAGAGYVWGTGTGFFEYVVPARDSNEWTNEIIVRANLRPVPPAAAPRAPNSSRVTLHVNGADHGSRLVTLSKNDAPSIHEWRIADLRTRFDLWRNRPLTIRFAIEPDADLPHGLNISNIPDRKHGVEVEVR